MQGTGSAIQIDDFESQLASSQGSDRCNIGFVCGDGLGLGDVVRGGCLSPIDQHVTGWQQGQACVAERNSRLHMLTNEVFRVAPRDQGQQEEGIGFGRYLQH